MTLAADNAIRVTHDAELIGEIRMWPTGTPPSGWLICDGSSISTTTYAALFAVIGFEFGGSGGSFNIPDFRDRSPQGVSQTDALAATMGVKLQTSVPQHRHEVIGHDTSSAASYVALAPQNNLVGRYTNYTGTAGGVDQRGPRLAINFIIRY